MSGRSTARALVLAGSATRLAYGVGALVAPEWMARRGFAPQTHDQADPRLLQRGFGGHQILIVGLTLAALRDERLMRPALAMNVGIDVSDVLSALLEFGPRGGPDQTTIAGIAFSGLGVATFAAAWLAGED